VLADDMLASGATATECASVLLNSGAERRHINARAGCARVTKSQKSVFWSLPRKTAFQQVTPDRLTMTGQPNNKYVFIPFDCAFMGIIIKETRIIIWDYSGIILILIRCRFLSSQLFC